MKIGFTLPLLLFACSHSAPPRPEFTPPASALNHEELMRAFPADLFRGDIAGSSREGDATEYLTFVFFRAQAEDQVPMRVALYVRKKGEALGLASVAHTPFTEGECKRGECRARISEMPGGFQLSRESFGADHLRVDYRFVRASQDLELVGKGFQAKNDRGEACSVYYDYGKRRIIHRRGKEARAEDMPAVRAPRLIADQLRFETALPGTLCALPANPLP